MVVKYCNIINLEATNDYLSNNIYTPLIKVLVLSQYDDKHANIL